MSRRTRVHGMNELQRVLRSAPGKILGESEKALFKAGGIIKRAAQALAPEGAGLTLRQRKALAGQLGLKTQDIARAGRLKRNILVKRSRGYARGMKASDRKNERIVVVYVRFSRARKKWDPKNAWYAHFIEWGTAKIPAKPFMTPAWRAHEAEAARTVREAARQIISQLRPTS